MANENCFSVIILGLSTDQVMGSILYLQITMFKTKYLSIKTPKNEVFRKTSQIIRESPQRQI